MITSVGNKKVKDLISLVKKSSARKKKNAYVVEGIRMFLELDNREILEVYAAESFEKDNRAVLSEKYPDYELMSDRVFEAVSDTRTPQGVMAVVKKREYKLDDILNKKLLKTERLHNLLIIDSLQDPGNLGTLLRAGEGAGLTGIIMNNTTADIYNPKVIRSTMGSVFRVPFVYVNDLKEAIDMIKLKNINIYASSTESSTDYAEVNFKNDTAFVIGNEAAGISRQVLDIVPKKLKIPMLGEVESLNAAIAGSLLMYEAARQRRLGQNSRDE